VQQVVEGGPAAAAGIQGATTAASVEGAEFGLGGDIITAVNGKSVSTGDNLVNEIARKKEGDKVKIDVLHDGRKLTVEVTLAARPAQTPGNG
jgi:S1-C subfamily serine protease